MTSLHSDRNIDNGEGLRRIRGSDKEGDAK